MLIKGVLLFLALGLLFFIVTMGVEYFLWLNPVGRMILFFCFIAIGVLLLYRLIFTPLLFLFRIRKGISNRDASLLIGKHFSEVDDRLYNLLDLAEDKNQSELLLASIEQRSNDLKLIPFSKAVDFRENLKYGKYLIIPIFLFLAIWISGNIDSFFNSYKRVVNYDVAYEPPAPFRFELLTHELEVLQDKSYTIYVTTRGDIRPDVVNIGINGKKLLLQQENGKYKYTFSPPLQETDFYFVSGKVMSKTYRLNVLKTPSIQNFEIRLEYPEYVNRDSEILKSTGNATIPEGTKVTWKLSGHNMDQIHLIDNDTVFNFSKYNEDFTMVRRIYHNYDYQISTSNENVKEYEKLDYKFTVIKDEFPTLKVEQVLDSLNPNISFYVGESSDDYKLTSVKLVCYPQNREDKKQIVNIGNPHSNFNRFYYTFPSGLQLEEETKYNFYFVVTDNDAIRNGKATKSRVFSTVLLNKDDLRNRELDSQQSIIDNMDKSLEKFREQKEALQEINREQKEKEQLNFNDQKQIKDFLVKQQQQEDLMQKFSKQLKDNLKKSDNKDNLNKLLQERLERQELEAKKNQKLLEELNKIADKIKKEDLSKRLEELGKKQRNSERSLEQLLELTKRYYVTEKASQLAKDLEEMAEKQEVLSEFRIGENFSKNKQESLNEDFRKLADELEELKKDNEDLKKPLKLKIDKAKEEGIKQDQREALDEIDNHLGNEEGTESGDEQKSLKKVKQKQKSAAQKMKEMSEDLGASASGGSESTIVEDAGMLRQILDNLIVFSFKQEGLFESLEKSEVDAAHFSGTVRKQKELRNLFEHVDDSLFALSLRRVELSEFVNEQITDVYYNIDKSLERMAENQIYQGVSYQKYVLNASNNLADFLANLLDNMQQSMMSGSGSGNSEKGFQLPDIIRSQGELKEKMEGMGQSKGGQSMDGEGQGRKGEHGEEGKDNSKSGKGKDRDSEDGEEGERGKKGNNGKSGDEGHEGEGQGELSEEELKEIYEIYKEQQLLRQKLEQQLQDMINASDRNLGQKLIKQMEGFEDDLLENGITQRTLSRVNRIQHQLLKLENATLKQGKKSERESNTNLENFNNPILTRPGILENYRNEAEILNRHTLPLRQNFQNRVKEYFKSDD